jgi:hypothetical protein
MRHQCSNCFSEFSDDAPSSSPAKRVFCVFCGTQLEPPGPAGAIPIPFSIEHSHEDTSALGVIGGNRSGFPETLRQFRVGRGPHRSDSLSPVHGESEEQRPESIAAPWRTDRFWLSLAGGFGVGACVALLFSVREPSPASVLRSAAARPAAPVAPAAPTVTAARLALPGCVASAAPVLAVAPVDEAKPPVTPVLEKRFWLERARSAQHHYRLAEAERFYRRVLLHAPRDSEALSGLGEVELLRGQRAAGEAHFHEALAANADYVPARVALADSYWQAGQAGAARDEYRKIVEQYSADLLPPHVSQRLESDACLPQCTDASGALPAPGEAQSELMPEPAKSE